MNGRPEKTKNNRFQRRRYGVYELTYEPAGSPFEWVYSLLEEAQEIRKKVPYAKRFITDTIKIAPVAFTAYMVTTVWQGVYRAINVYWLSILFDMLGNNFTSGALVPEVYQSLATSWVYCVTINIALDHIHTRSLEVLNTRYRAYFIPRLIRASLTVDLLSIKELRTCFPAYGVLESEFPGGHFPRELKLLVYRVLNVTSQLFVLLHAISRKRSPEREILLWFCVVRAFVEWLVPVNAINSSAYIYWSNNRHFRRTKSLFGLALSTQYRADLMLDGVASSVETEYEISAAKLGNVGILAPLPWCADLAREWYWDFLVEISFNCPLAMYALFFSAHLESPSTVASMVLLQEVTQSISFAMVQHDRNFSPRLLDICSYAKRFYECIDRKRDIRQGIEPFPRAVDRTYDAGMKISFRHVSLLYPGGDHHALDDVSFDIHPGELVLVVGTNGSGKSSMLKLLARLFDPTAGEILIDDVLIGCYDADQVRAAMTFQSQSPVIYPVTVGENIAFSLPPSIRIEQADVEEAARMGGCEEWVARLGDAFDTRLEPSFDIDNGWTEGVAGCPSDALMEEFERHKGPQVSISGGEKQRLATARTFMRMNHCRTKLVVVDEATSALDPVAEDTILTELRKRRAGKTIVLVTHRFYHLAHGADRILCMKDGSVVENGTHAELVRLDGTYAAMYNAHVRAEQEPSK